MLLTKVSQYRLVQRIELMRMPLGLLSGSLAQFYMSFDMLNDEDLFKVVNMH